MKNLKNVVSILLAIIIMLLANIPYETLAATSFSDVKSSSWYYTYVNQLMNLKITSGIGNNKYGPDLSITRAEFITFLCKAHKLPQEDGYTFSDTKAHWARKWISAAITANIIDKGTAFNPNKSITRQEAVEMLCRSLGLTEDKSGSYPFTDVKDNRGYSSTAYKEYLMQGSLKNNLRYFYPNSDIKRSEVSAVVVNLVDYKADTAKYKTIKKAELDKQIQTTTESQAEAQRYLAWKESVKGIPSALLNNTKGLYYDSVYESYTALFDEKHYYETWADKYGMTADELANKIVELGTEYANAYANANYAKIDIFESTLRTVLEPDIITNYLQNKLNYIKNNTVVSEGKFITSKGLIVCTKDGQLMLRGTMRYKYASPTSIKLRNSEIVSDNNKGSLIGVWYEQDVDINFFPRNVGLKCNGMYNVSEIRLNKFSELEKSSSNVD